MGGGNDSSDSDSDWHQCLFRPPAQPLNAGLAADTPDDARAYHEQFDVYRRALHAPRTSDPGDGKRSKSVALRLVRGVLLACALLMVVCELALYMGIRVACDHLLPAKRNEEKNPQGGADTAARLRALRRRAEHTGGRRAMLALGSALLGGALSDGALVRTPQYAQEACASLMLLRRTCHLDAREKLALARSARGQLGCTALCLSGGAALAWKHLGVARLLLDAGCLPHVLSGASAGALVAALLATHTDAELRRVLHPGLAQYMTACHDPWRVRVLRWLRTGALFDPLEWAPRAQVFTRGAVTFAEAYARTGRALSIPCAPRGRGRPRVLNHVTTPDVLVWSAVLASASLPGVLPSTVLLCKRGGRVRTYAEHGTWWRDGSFLSDIPLDAVRRAFNVGCGVVSQVNPHVAWFQRRAGATGLAHALLLDVQKTLRWMRDTRVLPWVAGQDWSCVWTQRFHGDVTVLPRTRVSELPKLLSDPAEPWLARCFDDGARAVRPWVAGLQTRRAVEDAVAHVLADARAADAFAQALHCAVPDLPRVDSGVDHADDHDELDGWSPQRTWSNHRHCQNRKVA